jgi:hypothetical protein
VTPDGLPETVISRGDRGYVVEIGGVVTVEISFGGLILSQVPAVGVHPLDAAEAVEQNIVPRLPQLLGAPNLHASAVAFEGRGLAFQGRSGMGKSTLATLMIAAGSALVCDDVLTLQASRDAVLASPSSHATSLFESSARVFADALGAGEPSGNKLNLTLPTAPGPVAMSRMYILGGHTPKPTIEPLRQRDAMLEIAAHLHRLDPTDPRLLAMELEFLEAVTRVVRVARLSHPRRFEERDALVDAILRDLEEPR